MAIFWRYYGKNGPFELKTASREPKDGPSAAPSRLHVVILSAAHSLHRRSGEAQGGGGKFRKRGPLVMGKNDSRVWGASFDEWVKDEYLGNELVW